MPASTAKPGASLSSTTTLIPQACSLLASLAYFSCLTFLSGPLLLAQPPSLTYFCCLSLHSGPLLLAHSHPGPPSYFSFLFHFGQLPPNLHPSSPLNHDCGSTLFPGQLLLTYSSPCPTSVSHHLPLVHIWPAHFCYLPSSVPSSATPVLLRNTSAVPASLHVLLKHNSTSPASPRVLLWHISAGSASPNDLF